MAGYGFSSRLREVFNKPEMSDVTILLDGDADGGTRPFYAHRIVLATMSDFFRAMFFGSFVEADQKEVRLPGVLYEDFVKCASLMYHGWNDEVERAMDTMCFKDVKRLFEVFDMLLLSKELRVLFDTWLAQQFMKWRQDFWAMLLMASDFNLTKLRDRCVKRLANYANEFLRTKEFGGLPLNGLKAILNERYLNCTKTELSNAVHRWIAVNLTSLGDDGKKWILESLTSRKEAVCYDGLKMPLFKVHDANLPQMPQSSTNAEEAKVCEFVTRIKFLQCLKFFGIAFNLKCSKGLENASKTRSKFKFSIFPIFCRGLQKMYYRTTMVSFDITQMQQITIFFSRIKFCKGEEIRIVIEWKRVDGAVEPSIEQICFDNDVVETTEPTFLSHVYCRLLDTPCDDCYTSDTSYSSSQQSDSEPESGTENESC